MLCYAVVSEMDDPFDYTLTVKNVVNSIKPVTKWFELGLQLDIEHCELEKIRNDRRDTDPCKMEMVAHWLKNDLTATWKKLCDALETIGEARVAQQIVSDYPKLKEEYEEMKRKIAENLQKLEQENTNDRIEDEEYEQRQRAWEERNEQTQEKSKVEVEFGGTQQENEEAIRDALHKLGIEWAYDTFTKSAADRGELEHLKEKMQAQTEGGRMFKERARNLKKKKEALCNRTKEFEDIEEYLHQDENELEYHARKLQKLGWLPWLVRLPDVVECNKKISQCRDRLRVCQEQSRICKEALRRSDFQLSDCRAKIESCTSELRYLQKEYERCSRTVKANMEELKKTASTLETTIEEWAAGGAAVGAATGIVVGTAVLPVVGTVVGAATGAAVGYFGGKAVGSLLTKETEETKEQRLVRSQLTRCEDELKACENTLRECQAMAEDVKNKIDELENLTCTLFD